MEDDIRETASSSLERIIGVLDIFTTDKPVWNTEEIASTLGCSKSTAYRYVRVLAQARLLTPTSGGTFILGARIIELDRQIRQIDPLIGTARKPMAELAKHLGENLILSQLYGDHVICVHEERADGRGNGNNLRGLTAPLFRGAVSKVILANLPTYTQKKMMLRYSSEIAQSDLGPDWAAFRQKLKAVKAAGYCIAAGEVEPELIGIAVPLFDTEQQVAGSLCVIRSARSDDQSESQSLLGPMKETAKEISMSLAPL